MVVAMSQQPEHAADDAGDGQSDGQQSERPSHVVIVGPDGQPVAAVPASALLSAGR